MDLAGQAHRLPQNRRLVPQTVMRHPIAGPLRFGFEMGTGVRTYSPSVLPLATFLLIALWSGSLALALVAGLGFGAGRGLVHPFRRTDPESWDARLRTGKRWVALWCCAAYLLLTLRLLAG